MGYCLRVVAAAEAEGRLVVAAHSYLESEWKQLPHYSLWYVAVAEGAVNAVVAAAAADSVVQAAAAAVASAGAGLPAFATMTAAAAAAEAMMPGAVAIGSLDLVNWVC